MADEGQRRTVAVPNASVGAAPDAAEEVLDSAPRRARPHRDAAPSGPVAPHTGKDRPPARPLRRRRAVPQHPRPCDLLRDRRPGDPDGRSQHGKRRWRSRPAPGRRHRRQRLRQDRGRRSGRGPRQRRRGVRRRPPRPPDDPLRTHRPAAGGIPGGEARRPRFHRLRRPRRRERPQPDEAVAAVPSPRSRRRGDQARRAGFVAGTGRGVCLARQPGGGGACARARLRVDRSVDGYGGDRTARGRRRHRP